jgi:WD40 repeat protein
MTAITGLAASPWAPLLAVAGQKQILFFNTDTFAVAGILPFPQGEPVDLKFSQSGKLLLASGGTGAKSGGVVVWDVVTGEPLFNLGGEYDTVLAADVRPDQSQIALGGPNRLVKIYSTKTGELLFKIKKHTDWVTVLAFSPDGQMLATADRNGGVCLWDPDRGQELFTLVGHKSAVTALSWRTDSKLLASSSEDGTIKIWETKEGKRVKSWTAQNSGALCVSYASNGQLVSCGRDNAIILWDGNGSKVRSFEFFGNIPLRVAINHNCTRIAATDFTGRVALWSVADAKRLTELDPNPMLLGDQIAAAQERVNQIEAQQEHATGAESPNIGGQTKDSPLVTAKSVLNRLEALRVLSYAYQLRERLAFENRAAEPAQLHAELQTDDRARLNRLLRYYYSLLAESGALD